MSRSNERALARRVNDNQPLPPRALPSAARNAKSSARSRAIWGWLLCLGLITALAGPFLAGLVYTADDLGAFHLPLRDFYAHQIASDQPFDWMPSLFCGFYLTGEGQVGPYHPLHWLLYRWLPLGAAFDLELLLSYPFLLAGSYFWLRRLVRQPDAALFGAVTFTFSGFCLAHFVHPNAVAVVAHLPWLLWAIDVSVRPASPRQAVLAPAGIALLVGSQLLLGYPQYVWLSFIAAAAYALWRITQLGKLVGKGFALRAVMTAGGRLLVAALCGTMIGGQQWLPTLDCLGHSTRAVANGSLANSGSMHPLNLLQAVAPYLFRTRVVGQNTHELSLYCGAVSLLLCVWLLSNRRSWGSFAPLIKAATVLGIVGALLACGEYSWVYPLQRFVPLVKHFRFPCRAIVLVQLAIAVLAAVAWVRLTHRPRRELLPAPWQMPALWVPCLLAVSAAVAGPLMWPDYTAEPLLVWAGPALICAAAMLMFAALDGRKWALYALLALAVADQGVYGLTAAAFRSTADINTFAAAPPLPTTLNHGNGGARIVAEPAESPYRTGDRWLLAGFNLADGYAGLEPQRVLDYHSPRVQRVAGVAFASIAKDGSTAAASEWQAVADPLPRARLVTKVQTGAPAADLSNLDIDHVAAVEKTLNLPAGKPGEAQLLIDRAGKIDVATQTTSPQLLVLNEAYDRGWQATVDGKAVPVLPVNADFLGCMVPAGDHRVALEFRPKSLLVGRVTSACGLGLLVALVSYLLALGGSSRSPRRREVDRRRRAVDTTPLELQLAGNIAQPLATPPGR